MSDQLDVKPPKSEKGYLVAIPVVVSLLVVVAYLLWANSAHTPVSDEVANKILHYLENSDSVDFDDLLQTLFTDQHLQQIIGFKLNSQDLNGKNISTYFNYHSNNKLLTAPNETYTADQMLMQVQSGLLHGDNLHMLESTPMANCWLTPDLWAYLASSFPEAVAKLQLWGVDDPVSCTGAVYADINLDADTVGFSTTLSFSFPNNVHMNINMNIRRSKAGSLSMLGNVYVVNNDTSDSSSLVYENPQQWGDMLGIVLQSIDIPDLDGGVNSRLLYMLSAAQQMVGEN